MWIISNSLMNSLCSQEQGGVSLQENCLDGERYAQSNGSPTPLLFCAQDKMKAFSKISQSGMMCKPLTESRGEELLTLYLGAFHVKTSVLQEKELESTEKDQGCGSTWLESLAKYDLNSCSWKTAQLSFIEGLEQYLEIFPKWGMMQNGELFQLRPSVQTIKEIGSGSWATTEYWGTPKAQDSRHALRDRGKGNLGEQVSGLHNGGKLNPTWAEWLMGWPLGWTDLKPLEMGKSLFAQQPHGTFCHNGKADFPDPLGG